MEYANAWSRMLSVLFPIRCFGCGVKGTYICIECASAIPKTASDTHGFISVFQYKDPIVRSLLHTLKYKGGKDLARACTIFLYEVLRDELGDALLFKNFKSPLVIPIPLSKRRRRERGFNQAELIAQELIRLDPSFELCGDVLVKTKNTPSQTEMKNKAERIRNVKDSFMVQNGEKILERNIILVDDIYTTGATLNEARETLLSSGARDIFCATVAH